jgi:N-methylhydantoinase A
MNWVVAVDIGGTFTDVVAVSDDGSVLRHKTLSTPGQPELAVKRGIEHLRSLEPGLSSARRIVHGTTLVSNALISRTGVPTGLLTTRGFKDMLATGSEGRYSLFDPFAPMPAPLVRRRLRHEVTERTGADGEVLAELSTDEVEQAITAWQAEGITSVAVFFINSYANPANEDRARELLERSGAFESISVSSDISRRLREVPRLSTAVADAYVKPLVVRYLNSLDEWLDAHGYTKRRYMMQSESWSQVQPVPSHSLQRSLAPGVTTRRSPSTWAGRRRRYVRSAARRYP